MVVTNYLLTGMILPVWIPLTPLSHYLWGVVALRLWSNTPNWNTAENATSTKLAIFGDSFHSCLTGIVCGIGVCCVSFLDWLDSQDQFWISFFVSLTQIWQKIQPSNGETLPKCWQSMGELLLMATRNTGSTHQLRLVVFSHYLQGKIRTHHAQPPKNTTVDIANKNVQLEVDGPLNVRMVPVVVRVDALLEVVDFFCFLKKKPGTYMGVSKNRGKTPQNGWWK